MNGKALYSVRMRASADDHHLSGAERIVSVDQVNDVVRDLLERAQSKHALPDRITLTLDSLRPEMIRSLPALDVRTLQTEDVRESRSIACRVLEMLGVARDAALFAMQLLDNGASSTGSNMRGAVIMDKVSGERLEPDQERGVRVSRFDWNEDIRRNIADTLASAGLTHHRTRDALALATKVAHAPGMIAELCWSDDPDYTAGYVASLGSGYIRFTDIKYRGVRFGGRVFFVDRQQVDIKALIQYLECSAVLISSVGTVQPPISPGDCFASLQPAQ